MTDDELVAALDFGARAVRCEHDDLTGLGETIGELVEEVRRLTRERDEALTRCQHLNGVEARIEDLFECHNCEHAETDECVRAELRRRVDPDSLLSDVAVEAASLALRVVGFVGVGMAWDVTISPELADLWARAAIAEALAEARR